MKMSNPLEGPGADGLARPADDVRLLERLLERQAAERRWRSIAGRLAAWVHDRPLQEGEEGCNAACGRCTAQ